MSRATVAEWPSASAMRADLGRPFCSDVHYRLHDPEPSGRVPSDRHRSRLCPWRRNRLGRGRARRDVPAGAKLSKGSKARGRGTFTRAIAELAGRGSRIYAVDRDASALAALTRRAEGAGVEVIAVTADFTGPFDLPGLAGGSLDGILLANALHFVPDGAPVLRQLTSRVRPGGRVVLVEYDQRTADRWVPYPIPSAHWPALAASAGLTAPVISRSRRSAFGGVRYVAVAERAGAEPAG